MHLIKTFLTLTNIGTHITTYTQWIHLDMRMTYEIFKQQLLPTQSCVLFIFSNAILHKPGCATVHKNSLGLWAVTTCSASFLYVLFNGTGGTIMNYLSYVRAIYPHAECCGSNDYIFVVFLQLVWMRTGPSPSCLVLMLLCTCPAVETHGGLDIQVDQYSWHQVYSWWEHISRSSHHNFYRILLFWGSLSTIVLCPHKAQLRTHWVAATV